MPGNPLQSLESPLLEFSHRSFFFGRRQFAAFASFCDTPFRRFQTLV
jgi:hypothetical protein